MSLLAISVLALIVQAEDRQVFVDPGASDGPARILSTQLGLQARFTAVASPVPTFVLRVGEEGLPSVVVIERPPVGEERQLPSHAKLTRAGEIARTIIAESEELEFAVEVIVHPGFVEGSKGSVDFDLNFPTGWDRAKEKHGAEAGYYPGQRADVGVIVDWLLAPERGACLGVVALGAAPARAVDLVEHGISKRPSPVRAKESLAASVRVPGSFEAFVEDELGRRFLNVPSDSALSDAVRNIYRSSPSFSIETEGVRRIGASTWLVDLHVDRSGVPHARSQELFECRLGVAADSGTTSWLGCALEGPGGVFEVREHFGNSVRFACEKRMQRIRLVVHSDEPPSADERLHLEAIAPGARPGLLTVPLVDSTVPREPLSGR